MNKDRAELSKIIELLRDKYTSEFIIDISPIYIFLNMVWKEGDSLKMVNLSMNPSFQKALGYSGPELLKIHDDFFEKIVHKDLLKLELKGFNQLCSKTNNDNIFHSRYHYKDKNGKSLMGNGCTQLVGPVPGTGYWMLIYFVQPVPNDTESRKRLRHAVSDNIGKKSDKSLAKLSKREIDVFFWLIETDNLIEIGETLSISWHTVDNHRTNIHKKLKIKGRAQLMQFAIKKGFIKKES